MPVSRFRNATRPGRAHVLMTESVLVEQYGELVRLAYLVLPAALGRHRRVLRAHALAQRALPGSWAAPGGSALPAQRRGGAPGTVTAPHLLRVAVLRAALGHGRRPRLWPRRVAGPGALLPRLPLVIGLRLFPRSGTVEDMALNRVLSGVDPAVRGAFVLRYLDRLPEPQVLAVLRDAGTPDPAAALRAADRLPAGAGTTAAALLGASGSREFDACTVQAHPTDLLRRRRRVRLAGALAGAGLVTVTALVVTDVAPAGDGRDAAPVPGAPLPGELRRAASGAWDDTSRVDFTAWPARGGRSNDAELLGRALNTWFRPPRGTDVTVVPGTPTDPPPRSPQLLYAGEVGARAVVLFHDGRRLVRYSESTGPDRPASLVLARADDADVTTAAAVAVDSAGGAARYLLAPWIAEAGTRDLLRPDAVARQVEVSRDGVTAAVRAAADGTGCTRRTVLQVRSSARIAEDHAFLLAGFAGLSPAHLTYTPLPGDGEPPARQPREATGSTALAAWSRLACALGELPGHGVRAVNAWDFADQRLPRDGGRGVWSCSRAVTWSGHGEVAVTLRTGEADPARVVARERGTAACGRFGQHVVAGARWKAPDGEWYLLAAGSREVTRLEVTGDVTARTGERTLALRAPRGAAAEVTGAPASGERLAALAPAS